MDNKLPDSTLSHVSGGISYGCLKKDEEFVAKTDDELRELANKFDIQKVGFCVCGYCPGCGKDVGYKGDVCNECRTRINCIKKRR